MYETDKGKIVVGIGYITCWQGERDSYFVAVFDTKDDAVSHIEETAGMLAPKAAEALGVSESI